MEIILETKIKEVGRITTYTTIKGKTKEELFDNIYQYFKSNQYCWQVDRFQFYQQKYEGKWLK